MEQHGTVLRASKAGKAQKIHLNSDENASPNRGHIIATGSDTDRVGAGCGSGTNLADNLSVGAVSTGGLSLQNVVIPSKSRRPKDNDFMQQRTRGWIVLLTPNLVAFFFLCIGILCIVSGIFLRNSMDLIQRQSIMYDSKSNPLPACSIENRGDNSLCNITFRAGAHMSPPIYVYYGLKDYYQNERKYFASRDSNQLLGLNLDAPKLCVDMNPCGLIANSTFNDTFTVVEIDGDTNVPEDYMVETGIAWDIDTTKRFKQPKDFWKIECQDQTSDPGTCEVCLGDTNIDSGCFTSNFKGIWYAVYYPEKDRITYLYKMFPSIVNPVEGVLNEHFMVWMRVAGKKDFDKIYGIINTPIPNGGEVTFQVNASYYVKSFHGGKELTISTLSPHGAHNKLVWVAYIFLGSISFLMAFSFVVTNIFYKRGLADTRYLDLRCMS